MSWIPSSPDKMVLQIKLASHAHWSTQLLELPSAPLAHQTRGKFQLQPTVILQLLLTSKLHANWLLQSLLPRPPPSHPTLQLSPRFVLQPHFLMLVFLQRITTSQLPQPWLFQTPCLNSLMVHQNVFLMQIGQDATLLEQSQLISPLAIIIHSRSVLTSVLPVDITILSQFSVLTHLPIPTTQHQHHSPRLAHHQSSAQPLPSNPRTTIKPRHKRLLLPIPPKLSSLVPNVLSGLTATSQDPAHFPFLEPIHSQS